MYNGQITARNIRLAIGSKKRMCESRRLVAIRNRRIGMKIPPATDFKIRVTTMSWIFASASSAISRHLQPA
jgi:hypothetical protein